MKSDVLMKYVRDRKGRKVGMLVGHLLGTGICEIGWSRCHKDDDFSREEGLRQALVNTGNDLPHSFAKAAKEFRTECFLRFNTSVTIPKVMDHGWQKRQSKPMSQKNSGHRMGCPCYDKASIFDCTCRELALKSRVEYGDNEAVQALGRVARG